MHTFTELQEKVMGTMPMISDYHMLKHDAEMNILYILYM